MFRSSGSQRPQRTNLLPTRTLGGQPSQLGVMNRLGEDISNLS